MDVSIDEDGIVAAQGHNAVSAYMSIEHLGRFTGASSSSPVELDIAFGVRGNSAPYLGHGWANPEVDFNWTSARETTLNIPQPKRRGKYILRCYIVPFVWRERLPNQRFSLSINGKPLGQAILRDIAMVEIEVPWSVIELQDPIILKFDNLDAAYPMEVKGLQDDRLLGFSFQRLSLIFSGADSNHFNRADDGASENLELKLSSESLHDLMMKFESLGENCEFGLVQRHCGAEPLGLLRFSSAPLPKLLSALSARFEGMGQPDTVEVQISGNNLEYMIFDKRFQFLYHAWVKRSEATGEEIHDRECRRLPFLVRKLLEDLSLGEKIFVYHDMNPEDALGAVRLAAALRAYGPATLLSVELADSQHPSGTAEWRGVGLIKGYVDRFAPGENAYDLSLQAWIDVCRHAYELWAENN